ncbi:ribosomal subunit 39S-domain-containing protein [Xylaria flabelliformis]|nr:ribosomal subunit 39S-domain-containing protein [Xylaria flabelliformis]
MRRIPRLRRPSGLLSATTNVSRATGSQFTTTQSPPSCERQRPTATVFHPPSLNRFYSSDRQQTPTPAPAPVQEQSQELQPLQPLQPRVADEIIDAETEENLDWADEGRTANGEGPYVAPPQRVEAARETDVVDPTYIPASTAQGLKKVGGLADWWYRPDNWDVTGDFTSFRPREKIVDPVLIEAAVRRAVVEALALREVGSDDELVAVWPTVMSKSDLHGLLNWGVKSTEDGRVMLGGDPAAVAEGLRWKDEEDAPAGSDELTETLTSEEVSALAQTWDPSWKIISLTDPRIRFAVTKRVFQLTGQLVPDHQLPSTTTVQALLRVLKKPLKPATLNEEIQKRHPDLLELPNVTVAAKRVTRGDKEKALGRFKIMQEEFKKRDIPGIGHGYARKGKELQRLKGDL